MAATVRVIEPRPGVTLELVGAGRFGVQVARLLAGGFPGSGVRSPDDLSHAFTADSAAVVVAAPRPSWALCSQTDQLAYRFGRPWLPVMIEHPVLRVGPFITPPDGPCFECYRARRIQHDPDYSASVVIDAACDSGIASPQAGYLPHHARLGAAMAARFLRSGAAGMVLSFDLQTSHGTMHPVIACHDCDHGPQHRARAVHLPAAVTVP